MGNIFRPVFYLKQRFRDWLYLCLEVEPTHLGPGTSCVSWTQLSGYHLKIETESSLRNDVFERKDMTMDNVQNFGSYIYIPSSQTYRSDYNYIRVYIKAVFVKGRGGL
jgi:hypothetical protein